MPSNYSLTTLRKLTHQRFRDAVNADKSRVLTPALELTISLRALNSGQASVVDRLLRIISEHPSTVSELNLAGQLVADIMKGEPDE